jgi:hypothetical protein
MLLLHVVSTMVLLVQEREVLKKQSMGTPWRVREEH